MAEKGGEVQLDRYRAACTYVQGDNHMGVLRRQSPATNSVIQPLKICNVELS